MLSFQNNISRGPAKEEKGCLNWETKLLLVPLITLKHKVHNINKERKRKH